MIASNPSDLRRLLNQPRAYLLLMRLIGADAAMHRFVAQSLRPHPGERVLDVGCGPGRLLGFLPAVSYVGIDGNDLYLARARSLYPGRRFERLDLSGDCSGFPDCDFDLIVACALLHHLSDSEAGRLLAFCRERLRPGGRLVALDCVRRKGQHPIARLLIALDRGRFVRDAPGYTALARREFARVETNAYDNLLRVPYSHFVMVCRK
jgi:SAM-dependent methyltransferase